MNMRGGVLKTAARSTADALLGRFDMALVRRSYWRQLLEEDSRQQRPSFKQSPLPDGTREYLQPDNPRLRELKQAYLGHPATNHSKWTPQHVTSGLHLGFFRGDNVYIWQVRDKTTEGRYVISTYYVKMHDRLGLLARLEEDELFGIHTFEVDDHAVSRDLLDSILEINFLDETLNLSGLSKPNILDIGAGYGRLAYRMVKALKNIGHVYCTDAIPESTFLCEYYLRFRGVDGQATTVPLHQVQSFLEKHPVDIATNIHSFSECSFTSICWWLDLLKSNRVRYLMIAPNIEKDGPRLLSREAEGEPIDFLPAITSRGYQLVACHPKYRHSPSAQKHGVFPTHYYLFELKTGTSSR